MNLLDLDHLTFQTGPNKKEKKTLCIIYHIKKNLYWTLLKKYQHFFSFGINTFTLIYTRSGENIEKQCAKSELPKQLHTLLPCAVAWKYHTTYVLDIHWQHSIDALLSETAHLSLYCKREKVSSQLSKNWIRCRQAHGKQYIYRTNLSHLKDTRCLKSSTLLCSGKTLENSLCLLLGFPLAMLCIQSLLNTPDFCGSK